MNIDNVFKRVNNLRNMQFPFEVCKVNAMVEPMPTFHWHDFWELSLITGGEGVYEIENSSFHVKQGTLVLINPAQRHRLQFSSDTRLFETVVHFEPRLLQSAGSYYIGLGTAEQLQNLPEAAQQSQCLGHFSSMCESYAKKENSYELEVLSNLYSFFLLLMRSGAVETYSPAEVRKRERVMERLNDILEYIHKEAFGDIKMSQLAAKFYMNETYFSEFFKQNVGMNYRDYLVRLRINEAIRLFIEGQLSGTEIAHQTGFGTTTGFYHAFKRVTGQSPSEYFNKNTGRNKR